MDPERAAASVEDLILDRLAGSGLSEQAGDLIMAALLGDDELAAAVRADGERGSRPERAEPAPAARPVPVYLRSVIVEGFRGIGPQAALRLQPGPGLTVVTGRNGSGKSSLAEAAELALTGDNKRWSDRPATWRSGWRNLHAAGPTRICLELALDGQPGVTKVIREWPAGDGLEAGTAFAQRPGGPRLPLGELGWREPLELFRPFLSYSELGALVSGKPSEMHDSLQAILGLDALIGAERRLSAARREAEAASKRSGAELPALLGLLAGLADERARRAEAALTGRPPDLAVIDALASGGGTAPDEAAAWLNQAAAIALPGREAAREAIARLAGAQERVAALAGTAAGDSRRLARLLGEALEHHAAHPGEPCPVCGGLVLDEAWAGRARAEISRLTAAAAAADQAHADLAAATRAVRALAGPAPPVLAEGAGPGGLIDAAPAREAWRAWQELAATGTVADLIREAEDRFGALAGAVAQLRERAAVALRQRSADWRPAAEALAAWAASERSARRAAVILTELRAAIGWLRRAGGEIRNARLAPFADRSARVWQMLRQESNVELGPVRLEGAATTRRVALDVTIDGTPGAALAVMSQGELHALGLALFLPRATAPDSPFRFVVIDDPVQSMDPAKVDGLAQLLAWAARGRQVVVFTHDDRLPEALRRLQLPATIWEVARRERSVVELRKSEDPVSLYLDDARALARTGELPEEARAVVTAGFCRSAIEAACHEAVRARRIGAGARHADVERALAEARTVHQVVALALFDDARRGDHVAARLRELAGQPGVTAFQAAKSGTHDAYRGDLARLVEDTARLAGVLRR